MDRIYLSPPHVGSEERRLLLEAFDSNWIAPVGPHLDRFEQEFAERLALPAAVALSSGTAALHLALMALDIGPGHEVIVLSEYGFSREKSLTVRFFADDNQFLWTNSDAKPTGFASFRINLDLAHEFLSSKL